MRVPIPTPRLTAAVTLAPAVTLADQVVTVTWEL